MIIVRMIIETLGTPEKLLMKTLQDMVKSIEKKYKVKETYIAKPTKQEGAKMFSSFIELTIDFKNMEEMFLFLTTFTPTSAEIIKPYKITMSAGEMENICNDVLSKIHALDQKFKLELGKNRIISRRVLPNITPKKI